LIQFYRRKAQTIYLSLILGLMTGCSRSPQLVSPSFTPASPKPASTLAKPSGMPAPTLAPLHVSLLFPTPQIQIKMGQSTRLIVQVSQPDGSLAPQAIVSATISDSAGDTLSTIALAAGADGAFRSDIWTVPHHSQPGEWRIRVEAHMPNAAGDTNGAFQVEPSTSEKLLAAYGFWLDAPTLRGIVPSIMVEEGNAQNGFVRWGGYIPAQHVLPENWIDVQWRSGDFRLDSPQAVQHFMFSQLGDLAMYPTRAIGPFEPVKFKNWEAWKVGGRGQYQQMHQEWMIFYAPEVDKTFSLGTLVIQPPSGVNAFAELRNSFEVYPDRHANGVAPEALPNLLPMPVLITPTLGAHFVGIQRPIVLKWQALKELAQDEYYRVDIQFNYDEGSPLYSYTTRQTQFTVPEVLYKTPNCHIFNWQVVLMHKTGEDQSGQPVGVALSYPSLYWYFQWSYPAGDQEPFTVLCPNAQT
jgi:hypothetical protein